MLRHYRTGCDCEAAPLQSAFCGALRFVYILRRRWLCLSANRNFRALHGGACRRARGGKCDGGEIKNNAHQVLSTAGIEAVKNPLSHAYDSFRRDSSTCKQGEPITEAYCLGAQRTKKSRAQNEHGIFLSYIQPITSAPVLGFFSPLSAAAAPILITTVSPLGSGTGFGSSTTEAARETSVSPT